MQEQKGRQRAKIQSLTREVCGEIYEYERAAVSKAKSGCLVTCKRHRGDFSFGENVAEVNLELHEALERTWQYHIMYSLPFAHVLSQFSWATLKAEAKHHYAPD